MMYDFDEFFFSGMVKKLNFFFDLSISVKLHPSGNSSALEQDV